MKVTISMTLTAIAVLPLLLNCTTGEDEELPVVTTTPTAVATVAPIVAATPIPTLETAETQTTPRYTAVSSGWYHACALREDGMAVCWGAGKSRKIDDYTVVHLGQAVPPQDERFVAISSGGYHTCGLREDGKVVCWGAQQGEVDEERGQAHPPPDERLSAIDSGAFHTCGLREDGSAVCWGDNELGKSTPPEGERFKAIASGGPHTCGLRLDGTAVCWGKEPSQSFGDSWQEPRSGEYSIIDAAYSHTCALQPGRGVGCWGSVSDAGDRGRYPPTSITANLQSISVESWRGCGLLSDGSPFCWGYPMPDPYPADYRFIDISDGGSHACAIREDNGGLVCWGSNEYGQASPPDGERYEEPSPKDGGGQ